MTLKRGQNIKYLPLAFTEHGVIMATTVADERLRGPRVPPAPRVGGRPGRWSPVSRRALYACFIQEGALTRDQKAEIASEITRIHCDLTGAPPSFVHVRFHTLARGDAYTGGKPAKSAVLDGTIRAGRPREVTTKLLEELCAMYQRVSEIPEWDLVVAIREIPAANVIEAGHVLPEPSEEKEWFAKHGASWEAT